MGFLLWRLPFAAILVLYDLLESYENTVENCENAVEHTIALEMGALIGRRKVSYSFTAK